MKHRVVIVGAGFAGLSAAAQLPEDCDVTVISRHPWCEFLPNIHELVSGHRQARDLRLDARGRIESLGHTFLRDEVVEIDVHGRNVRTRSGGMLSFDALIVAAGGVNAAAGVAGAEQAMPFKSVEDCVRIHDRLCEVSRDSVAARVVIVGGGLEGIEALGEILRAFPRLHIEIVEGGPRLMANAPTSLDSTIRRESAPFDVRFSVETTVAEVRSDGIVTSSDRFLPADVAIWTGGPAGAPLLFEAGLATRAGGWATATPDLGSAHVEGVFLAGDAAELENPVSRQAYHAIDMGVCAGSNARRWLAGQPVRPFVPAEKPTLVSFGPFGCFLVLGEWAVFGPAVSLAKEAVFQLVSTQLVPPRNFATALASVNRLGGALPEPEWPSALNLWKSVRCAADLRLLWPDGDRGPAPG